MGDSHADADTGRCTTWRRAAARSATALLALAAASIPMFDAGVAEAHDDIESSVPADRAVIDEPISSVEIDFGEVIGDSVEMFLTFDPGGDADVVDLGGDTSKTGDTTAQLDFDEIEQEGTYFVQYLAPIPSDGHVMIGTISFSYGRVTVIDDGENPDIRSSTPASRSRIDEPISSVEIEFDLEIGDDVTLTLVYDRGDGENFDELDGETERTGPNSAQLTFDELEREGTYFVLYDTTVALGGDELVGAISFTFGDPAAAESSFPWAGFLAAAIPILAIGAWFTIRAMRRPDDDPASDTDADPDVGPGPGSDGESAEPDPADDPSVVTGR